MITPTLLYIMHCYHNRAGVEEYVRNLQNALAQDFSIFVLFPEDGQIHLLGPDGTTKRYPGDPPQWPETPETLSTSNASIDKILRDVAPQLIHVQHFHNLPLSVLAQVLDYKAPSLISFHEYYAITPHYTMQGTTDPLECFSREYAERYFQSDISPYLQWRRDYLAKLLPRFHLRVVPSPFLARTMTEVFPADYRIIEYGIKPFEPLPRTTSQSLRFGYVGSLLPQKGWESLVRAFAALRLPPEKATLHFYGGLRRSDIPGIFFHDVYEQSDLAKICSQIDVAVIPSLFAETYSMVLSEMWRGQLPVAVSDIGALGERVRDTVNGRKFRPGDVRSIQEVLSWFLENNAWRTWILPSPRTTHEMATEYKGIYDELLN